MRFLRLLLWGVLACVCWVMSLAATILADLADNCDAVMCWLEHRQ